MYEYSILIKPCRFNSANKNENKINDVRYKFNYLYTLRKRWLEQLH